MSDDPHPRDDKHAIEAKLELLAKVTQLTLATVMKVLHARQAGPLTDEQQAKLELVRADLQRSLDAVRKWQRERPNDDLDLRGLEGRLEGILAQIEDEGDLVEDRGEPRE